MKLLQAIVGSVLLSVCPANADELSDKVCPILKQVAADGAGQADFMVQMSLVMAVGGAYEFKPEPLKTVLDDVDDATIAACPDDRTAVLKLVAKSTLREAMR
ncbi:MAG: hypothetical protein ABIQ30_13410 [Devosia sp.]